MVVPHSHSAFSLSKTQAYLKELPHLSSLRLKFFNGSFVDSTTSVDQMASSGRLAEIYMSNDHDVDVSPFLFHFGFDLLVVFLTPVFWRQTNCEKVGKQFLIMEPKTHNGEEILFNKWC